MTVFNPIIRELEYEDSNNHVTTMTGVDITPHLISAFTTTAEAVQAMNDENMLIESLRVAFEQDPSLTDDDGNQYPWSLYESDLRETLLLSLGFEDDDGSMGDEELWETWLANARSDGVDERHLAAMRTSFEDRIGCIVDEYAKVLGDGTLTDLATALLKRDGGMDALRSAIACYQGPDALGALRLAADIHGDVGRT